MARISNKQLLERIEAAEKTSAEAVKRAEAAEAKLESMQDEDARLVEKEAELDRKAIELHEKQQANRRDPYAVKMLLASRDKSIIRKIGAKNYIRCETKRKVGLNDGETSDMNETIDVEKSIAERLQNAGVIKVKL